MPYFPHIPVPLNEFDTHQALFNNIKAGEPASLPVSNSTHSFWLHPSKEVNPLAKEGSDGPLNNDADLCIIGSGITGISAAYHISKMSEKPMKVVILEARDFCKFSTYKIRLKYSQFARLWSYRLVLTLSFSYEISCFTGHR